MFLFLLLNRLLSIKQTFLLKISSEEDLQRRRPSSKMKIGEVQIHSMIQLRQFKMGQNVVLDSSTTLMMGTCLSSSTDVIVIESPLITHLPEKSQEYKSRELILRWIIQHLTSNDPSSNHQEVSQHV